MASNQPMHITDESFQRLADALAIVLRFFHCSRRTSMRKASSLNRPRERVAADGAEPVRPETSVHQCHQLFNFYPVHLKHVIRLYHISLIELIEHWLVSSCWRHWCLVKKSKQAISNSLACHAVCWNCGQVVSVVSGNQMKTRFHDTWHPLRVSQIHPNGHELLGLGSLPTTK